MMATISLALFYLLLVIEICIVLYVIIAISAEVWNWLRKIARCGWPPPLTEHTIPNHGRTRAATDAELRIKIVQTARIG